MYDKSLEKEEACCSCGRYNDLQDNERARELHHVEDRLLCFDCFRRHGPLLRGTLGEERVLNLIENWYG